MSSNLKVNTILPSAGTAIGIGTDGGTISLTGSINIGTGATISQPATNQLALGTNSSERLRILGDGKVRITGVSSITNMGQTLQLLDTDSTDAIGTKSTLGLLGYVNGTTRTLAAVGARKNSAGSDFAGDLSFFTRRNNQSLLDERVRITSSGNLNVLAGQVTVATPEFLRVAHTVNTQNQSLTDNATHWVQFGSAYDDTKSGWTSGANNYYTIQKAGYFLVTAQAVFHSNDVSSLRDWALGVEQSQDNGSSYSLIQNAGGRGGGNQYTDTDAIATCVTFILYFNAGTRIRVRAYANVNGGDWQIDEDLGDVSGGTDYGGANFDNQKGTRLHIIRLF